ncbi:MAG: hypothetical protein EP329_06850, partial [Deltaproteobacteria bacterium]
MSHRLACAVLLQFVLAGCHAGVTGDGSRDQVLAVDVAALNLQGVGDVVWDLEVKNGASTPEVIWQRRVASSRYGDGAGSASYVGTCDAAANPNTVRVWVVGVYSDPVAAVGSFAEGAAGGVSGSPVDFENPTASAPLERTVVCREDGDVAVQFDVALMRPAQQGFFDIAVSFNDIFCSAKFDCCVETGDGTACASDLALLFDATGSRAATMVLGFACTAGVSADVGTELFLDPLGLDCTSPSAGTFAADLLLDPSGAVGNQCVAGADGMSACAGVVTELNGVDADTYLYQLAVYRGAEQLTSGGVDAQKSYWTVALGVKRPAIDGCWLRTRATAAAHGSDTLVGGAIPAGTVYPYVQWEVALDSCHAEGLAFDDPDAMVRPMYTSTSGPALSFAARFDASGCVDGGDCASGVCLAGACQDPTCSDGVQNGDETDIDCGGSCAACTPCTPACQNGGVCIGPDTCDCFGTGFGGATCTEALSAPVCSPACANGGVCVATNTCDCTGTGYSGTLCDVLASCAGLDETVFDLGLTPTGCLGGQSSLFTVPAGVTSLSVKLWGGGGGGGNSGSDIGGGGGFASATVAVTPGETLFVVEGGPGGWTTTGYAQGGCYGGGRGGRYTYSAGGGGFSGLFRGSISQSDALVIAGGGAGNAGGTSLSYAGAGGGLVGQDGTAFSSAQGGYGGTQTAGGASNSDGQAGMPLRGGYGAVCVDNGAGGGGGGYWGG